MIVELVLGLLALVAYKFWKLHQKFDYWKKLGVKEPAVTPIIGNNPFVNKDVILRRKNPNDVVIEQYNSLYGEKIYGVLTFGEPAFMITDPDLIKQVCLKIMKFTMASAQSFSYAPDIGERLPVLH